MKKEVSVDVIGQAAGFLDRAYEMVANEQDFDRLEELYKRAAAARKYCQALDDIVAIREKILPIEIACIVRLRRLGGSIKSVSGKMADWFVEHGDGVEWYRENYPDCLSVHQIYRAYLQEQDIKDGYRAGYGAANGRSRIDHDATDHLRQFGLQEALVTIMKDIEADGRRFTLAEMSSALSDALRNEIPGSRPEAYRRAIDMACRDAILKEHIDVIGDIEAPRFVTYYDSELDDWARIPFENATLVHIDQMIALKADQVRQYESARDRLQRLRDELGGLSDDETLTVREILAKQTQAANI